MKALTTIRTLRTGILSLVLAAVAVAVATGPAAHAQAPDAAARQTVQAAHSEALQALRTGSTSPLRSYTPNAVAQVAEQLSAYADYGVTVTGASEPSFVSVSVAGNGATVVTRSTLAVTYFGFLPDQLTAEITWYLVNQNGRWVVDGMEIYF